MSSIAFGAGNLTADEAVGTFELIAEDGRCWRAELRHAAGSAVPPVVEAGVTAALHFVCARDRVLGQTAQCIGALMRLWYSQSIPSTRRITLDLALLETC